VTSPEQFFSKGRSTAGRYLALLALSSSSLSSSSSPSPRPHPRLPRPSAHRLPFPASAWKPSPRCARRCICEQCLRSPDAVADARRRAAPREITRLSCSGRPLRSFSTCKHATGATSFDVQKLTCCDPKLQKRKRRTRDEKERQRETEREREREREREGEEGREGRRERKKKEERERERERERQGGGRDGRRMDVTRRTYYYLGVQRRHGPSGLSVSQRRNYIFLATTASRRASSTRRTRTDFLFRRCLCWPRAPRCQSGRFSSKYNYFSYN